MNSPTDPRSPAVPPAGAPSTPSTQEIPVVPPAAATQQLPPHPGATTPPPVAVVQATGPVGVVPGPPGAHTAPPAPAAPGAHAPRRAGAGHPGPAARTRPVRDRAALLGLALVAVCLVLLELGLVLRFGGESFWSDIPLWSAFATVCALLGLAGSAALLPRGRPSPGTGWRIAAAGLVGLAVFWLLVVLPVVATDRGFLLTAALGCLGGALWAGAARRS